MRKQLTQKDGEKQSELSQKQSVVDTMKNEFAQLGKSAEKMQLAY